MAHPFASRLLHRLGGEVFAQPSPAGDAADQIGNIVALPVWAMADAPSGVAQHARRRARQGQLGLLIGYHSETDRASVVVTIPPVRITVLAIDDLDALPLRRLARATRVAHATELGRAIALAEALDVDAAGRRTFRMLHQLLERGIDALPASVSRDDRHAWTLAQITRLIFLRFIESEGWLDGNHRFLGDAFDRCLVARRDPTRHLLHPLFFGTLNRAHAERSRFARALGAIPFLNGGLFEPLAIERAHRLRLPVSYWRDAFDALVCRVDVTLDHDGDDGRVTPELLGRVFEGAMSPIERKQEGTFFTPPALVDAILRQALACHLAPRLRRSETVVERALDDPDAELRRLLLDITVLDPAVGSGAFLVGALGLLHGPGPRQPARVRHLVTRSLFGVDRHPGAVRVCELRLWLEVLRAMRGRPPGRVPPLPNLDACVRAGDALIDPLHGCSVDSIISSGIRAQQQSILAAHGAGKRLAIAAAHRAERAAILRTLDDRERGIDREIADICAAARSATLFGERTGLTQLHRREIAGLRRSRVAIRTERRRMLRDRAAAPFALGVAFAPVLTGRGGFDLVVGNPPWVRAEQLPPATRDALGSRFRWWRTGSGPGWRHQPDLAVAFVERGFESLAPGGTLAFLVPAKLATTGYGAACRSGLATKSTIHRVADLGSDPRAGFEATTYPLAVVASRRSPPPGHTVRLGLAPDDPAQSQAAWQEAGPWLTVSPTAQRVAARLARAHPTLGEFIAPQLGVKTGANAAFLDPPDRLREWCRPAIRGRDVRPFVATPGALLLWPADSRGTPWATLPDGLREYLEQERGRLQRRADQCDGPWWQLFRTRAATARYRVVWRDLSRELEAAVLRDNAVPLNSCYVAAARTADVAESLAAWLNASPVRALARMRAEPAAGGYARFAARTVGALPLPAAALGHRTLIALSRGAAAGNVQRPLDACAAELLGLDEEESAALRDVAQDRR